MAVDNSFSCSCCGECCRGDMHVYLNPDDLVLMADFLGFDYTEKLFACSYVIIDRKRNNAPLPRIRFSKGPAGCCPFLENRLVENTENDRAGGFQLKGLCRLHPGSKPLICMLAPVYRTVDLESGEDLWGIIPPVSGCPGSHSGDVFGFSEKFKDRLSSEKEFFIRLSDMLDQNVSEKDIIRSLYYIKTGH